MDPLPALLVSPEAATDDPLFFLEKSDIFFSHRPLESDDIFSCRLLTTPIFPLRLSSILFVLSKFSHKNIFFYSGVTPGMLSPGAVRPSLVTELERQNTPLAVSDPSASISIEVISRDMISLFQHR